MGGIAKPSKIFSEFFPNYDKRSAADAFSSCLFIPRMHFETSLVRSITMVTSYNVIGGRW